MLQREMNKGKIVRTYTCGSNSPSMNHSTNSKDVRCTCKYYEKMWISVGIIAIILPSRTWHILAAIYNFINIKLNNFNVMEKWHSQDENSPFS